MVPEICQPDLSDFMKGVVPVKDTRILMYEKIEKLLQNDLRLLKEGIPANGIWTVCQWEDTGYHGAVRIIPTEFGSKEYALWVDVFETIYDPIFSNSLYRGTQNEIMEWLQNQEHVSEIYDCMKHLHELAEDD